MLTFVVEVVSFSIPAFRDRFFIENLLQYSGIGKKISRADAGHLIHFVNEIMASVRTGFRPFGLLVGPSRSGKTLCSFVLESYFKVIHFVLEISSLNQSIYTAASAFGILLLQYVQEDILTYSKTPDFSLDLDWILNHNTYSMRSIGFIHCLCKLRMSHDTERILRVGTVNPLEFSPLSCSEFKNDPHYVEFQANCIFMLDEFNKVSGSKWDHMIFARNIFRSLEMVCILMGTDTAARNVLSTSTSSSSSGDRPWVFICAKTLPYTIYKDIQLLDREVEESKILRLELQRSLLIGDAGANARHAQQVDYEFRTTIFEFNDFLATWEDIKDLYPEYELLVEWIIDRPTPRAYFFKLSLRYLIETFKNISLNPNTERPTASDLLDALLKFCWKETTRAIYMKTAFSEWVQGQVASVLSVGRDLDVPLPDELITKHFAYLTIPPGPEPSSVFPLYLGYIPGKGMVLQLSPNADEEWTPSSCLKSVKIDELFYLSMLYSSMMTSPFSYKDSFISCFDAAQHWIKTRRSAVSDNSSTISYAFGQDLETITALSVIISSHINGLSGVPLFDFLTRLASEFCPSSKWNGFVLDENCDIAKIDAYKNIIIPYLAPEGSKFSPRLASIPGVRVSSVSFVPNSYNSDGIPLLADDPFTSTIFECKLYSDLLETAAMIGCFVKMWNNRKRTASEHLLLLVTTHIRENIRPSSFTTDNFTAITGNVRVFLAKASNNRLRFEQLFEKTDAESNETSILIVLALNFITGTDYVQLIRPTKLRRLE